MGPSTISVLADLASKHKLVPFMGAGCSKPQLGLDWDALVQDMATEISSSTSNHLDVAQEFIDSNGRDRFASFLRDPLTIDEFRDDVGYAHLAMLSLGVGVIYTTNQDNVFEKCAAKYGRRWRVVSQLSDLADYRPGERVYIKFHGDLSYPESLIYGREDFENRTKDQTHFMNIRLRSDLLAKSLLFVGYSFRDDTIHSTFSELQAAFDGDLPPAFLIAYRSSDQLEAACQEHGIEMIEPMKEFPKSANPDESLERYLQALVNQTFAKKHDIQMAHLFNNSPPSTQRVLAEFELRALEACLPECPVQEAAQRFRSVLDSTIIPKDFIVRVSTLVEQLADRCETSEDSTAVQHILIHLQISEPNTCLSLLSAVYATANVRDDVDSPFDQFLVVMNGCGFENLKPVIVAAAIKRLHKRGVEFTPSFFHHVSRWFDQSPSIEEFD